MTAALSNLKSSEQLLPKSAEMGGTEEFLGPADDFSDLRSSLSADVYFLSLAVTGQSQQLIYDQLSPLRMMQVSL